MLAKLVLTLGCAALAGASSLAGASYIDGDVATTRQAVLDDDLIRQINSNTNLTWKAHRNSHFESFSIVDAKALMGARTDGIKELPSISHDAATIAATPDSFDPRTARASCTGPVLDQVSWCVSERVIRLSYL